MDNYKAVLKQIMKEQRYSQAAFAEKLGVSRASVTNTLKDYRTGINLETLFRYCEALGARVVIEWQDPMDKRRNFRWHIGGAK